MILTSLVTRLGEQPLINQNFVITNIMQFLSIALGWGLVIGAVIVFGCLVISGFQWATAGNEPSKAKSARDNITNCIFGFGVLASTYAIALVVQMFVGTDNFQVTPPGPVTPPTPTPPTATSTPTPGTLPGTPTPVATNTPIPSPTPTTVPPEEYAYSMCGYSLDDPTWRRADINNYFSIPGAYTMKAFFSVIDLNGVTHNYQVDGIYLNPLWHAELTMDTDIYVPVLVKSSAKFYDSAGDYIQQIVGADVTCKLP